MLLHLDNSHNKYARGWPWSRMVSVHAVMHAAEDARLAEIEAAANLIGERLAEQPPAVVESVVDDRAMYLEDANGTVYLAEPIHFPEPGDSDLYRLTVVDLMAALEESLAKAKRTLAKPRREERPVPPSVDALPAAPSSTAAPSLLGTGRAGAAVGSVPATEGVVRYALSAQVSEGAWTHIPCRPAPSGNTGGAS